MPLCTLSLLHHVGPWRSLALPQEQWHTLMATRLAAVPLHKNWSSATSKPHPHTPPKVPEKLLLACDVPLHDVLDSEMSSRAFPSMCLTISSN